MRSYSNSWNTLWTELGFTRKKQRAAGSGNFNRHLRFEACEDRRVLATFEVNSLFDNGDGDNTTLREAIEQAQNTPGHDTIVFSTDSEHDLDGGTITLTEGVFSRLFISQGVTIDASMLDSGITIDGGVDPISVAQGGSGARVFDINVGNTTNREVTFKNLTITGGHRVYWHRHRIPNSPHARRGGLTTIALGSDAGDMFGISMSWPIPPLPLISSL